MEGYDFYRGNLMRQLALGLTVGALLASLASAQPDPYLVNDIIPGAASSSLLFLRPNTHVQRGPWFHFLADDGSGTGREMWKSDGTSLGTSLVKDIRPGSQTGPYFQGDLVEAAGTTFFVASDGVSGNELWKTDGTAGGTVMVKDIYPGIFSSYPDSLAELDGLLYFEAEDGATGSELWRSDGTAGGTFLFKDLNPGGEFSNGSPDQITSINGSLYFSAFNGFDSGLWKSDGTAAGTVMVKEISSNISQLTGVGATVFFRANDGTNGIELWKTDGSAAGTMMLKDINPGSSNSLPEDLTRVGSTLFFSAWDGIGGTYGRELWKSDGSPAGTVLVKDIYPGSEDSLPRSFVDFGGTLFFFANDGGTYGNELRKSDGTEAGTVVVKDIRPGSSSGAGIELRVVLGRMYFLANDNTGPSQPRFWVSDGTDVGTLELAESGSDGVRTGMQVDVVRSRNLIFFASADSSTGTELWALPVCDSDNAPCLFSDGFESGDTTLWSG